MEYSHVDNRWKRDYVGTHGYTPRLQFGFSISARGLLLRVNETHYIITILVTGALQTRGTGNAIDVPDNTTPRK